MNTSAPVPSATIRCSLLSDLKSQDFAHFPLSVVFFLFKILQLLQMFILLQPFSHCDSHSYFCPLCLHLHLVLHDPPTNSKHPHCLHLFFLSLCRASIVQKRIIYFQDEGSLTTRMCEKGRLLLLTWNK